MSKIKIAPVAATRSQRININLTGLVCVEVAPGVKFCTNSPESKVLFSWDTGTTSGSWTNITP